MRRTPAPTCYTRNALPRAGWETPAILGEVPNTCSVSADVVGDYRRSCSAEKVNLLRPVRLFSGRYSGVLEVNNVELLSGGEMLVRFLRDEGVKHIYGYPGGALLHVYDALFKEPEVTHILVRHEQAATHMADGYARATGKAGVVLVTSGPGATNAITGIATAYMDSIPMVIISGQVPSTMVETDAIQKTDMI